MNKLHILLYILLLLSIKSIAQTKVDSLDYYYQKQDFEKGIVYGEKIKANLEKEGKINNLKYAFLLDQIAEMYSNKKDYTKALNFYNEVLKIFILLNGENHKYVGFTYDKIRNIKFNIARTYHDEGNYKDAENLYNNILDIDKSKININSKEYAFMLSFKADVLEKQGDYDKAIETYNQILEIKSIDFDKCKIFSSIGMIYGKIADFKNSKKYFDKSLECNEDKNGKDNIEYIRSLENIAGSYSYNGDYKSAIKLYNEAISLKKKNNFPYSYTLGNLAYCYFTSGDFKQAENAYLSALNIYEKKIEFNDNDFLTLLYGLSEYYIEVGQIENSHSILKKTTFLKSNLVKLTALENGLYILAWSNYYLATKNYIKAEENYLLLLNGAFHVNDFNDSKYKSNLALIYSEQGDHEKSIKLYIDAFELRKDKLGDNPRNDVSLLHGLASEYEELNNYGQAEYYYTKAFNLFKDKLSEDNPIYDDLLYHASNFYAKVKSKDKAEFYMNKTLELFKKSVNNQILFQTNLEFNSFRKKSFFKRFYNLSFLQNYLNQYRELNIGCYENELLVKGLSLRNQQRIQNNIQNSGDATLKSNYEQFVANKRQLVKLQELPLDKRPSKFEKLAIETELLEKDLTRQSALFADAKISLSTTWKQIQEKLKPNEVAIDLVAFNYYNKKWTDSIVYAAFIVNKSSKYPKYIPLFEQKQLNALLQRNNAEHDSIQARKLNKQYTDSAIADLFLKSLQNELQNITTIYLSPAGLGHQINFSALPVSDNQMLGGKYALHLLGSTTSLIDFKPSTINKKENTELLLYGYIDYGKTNALKKEFNDESTLSAQIDFNELNTRGIFDSFGNLGGTLEEINKISDLAKEKGFQSTQIKQADATEESIKALDGKSTPYILHLATHGFFFPDPKLTLPENPTREVIYISSEDPMMRSGLALAGANKYWKKPIEKLTTDDGILTASEISNLDLSACQLVVLSACETGLGDINGSEGVFGLQRAFKMAGVKNIIMSLWKVPDAQTSELFEVFYNECFAGKTIHEAFQSAQSKMKAKYSPYYWAGFVLLE
jgi:CHAT domain-containing protein/tetratricopeptide (TPR) repeat protein